MADPVGFAALATPGPPRSSQTYSIDGNILIYSQRFPKPVKDPQFIDSIFNNRLLVAHLGDPITEPSFEASAPSAGRCSVPRIFAYIPASLWVPLGPIEVLEFTADVELSRTCNCEVTLLQVQDLPSIHQIFTPSSKLSVTSNSTHRRTMSQISITITSYYFSRHPTLRDSRYISTASSIASSCGREGIIRAPARSMTGGLTNIGTTSRSTQILAASLTRSVCRPSSSLSRPTHSGLYFAPSTASYATGSRASRSSAELEVFYKRMGMMTERIEHGENIFEVNVSAQYDVIVERDLTKSDRSGGKIRKFLPRFLAIGSLRSDVGQACRFRRQMGEADGPAPL
ncbi:hypothetical protein BDK51DRAFT_44101 [Blyttiomyces helicus]|uniref:Uncharacterized protein n=1 Tax=Blyttiomyces helicus TaxID=388810 RepID=A0A4P9WJH1_9FUNG|nr:hypothetical protein BDK51DRAFT_44101 [Blyttiomyces helicus]|eukprot:RKO93079.1 hypothetical protein BDK51DRAFT_44101 [Blyttiomyces helicus]